MATGRFDRTSALARPTKGPTPDLQDLSLYTNRELSWLEFNQRVLDQAIGDHHPLLERVKFLAITASNLDEFFMVRIATLLKKQRVGVDGVSLGGLGVSQKLAVVRQRAMTLMKEQAACWQDSLRPALEQHGIRFLEGTTIRIRIDDTCAPTSARTSFRCSHRSRSIPAIPFR